MVGFRKIRTFDLMSNTHFADPLWLLFVENSTAPTSGNSVGLGLLWLLSWPVHIPVGNILFYSNAVSAVHVYVYRCVAGLRFFYGTEYAHSFVYDVALDVVKWNG